jgi:hypothetical protein
MRWLAQQAFYWLAFYLSLGFLLAVLLVVGCGRPVEDKSKSKQLAAQMHSSCDHVCLDKIERAMVESYLRNGR